RGEEDALIVVVEVAAGRLALAGAHHADVGAVHVHDVLLVACAAVAAGLEDELRPVAAEIRFGVLAAVGDLQDLAKESLPGIRLHLAGERRRGRRSVRRSGSVRLLSAAGSDDQREAPGQQEARNRSVNRTNGSTGGASAYG